jgi:hypothetical protein
MDLLSSINSFNIIKNLGKFETKYEIRIDNLTDYVT